MSQFFATGAQSIGALASASVLPMNIQVWYPLGLTGLISLQSKGLSRVFSNTTVQRDQRSMAQSCLTLCNTMNHSTRGLPVHHQLPEFTQTHAHWVGDAKQHLVFCRTLLLPSIFPSVRVFSNASAVHIRWPKYWSFSFSISLSNEYSGLISWRLDWSDLLEVQGTLKSPPAPQFESINSLALSLLYDPAHTSVHNYWKNHSFDRALSVMSLLFYMLSRFVIAFLPRSKHLLIS